MSKSGASLIAFTTNLGAKVRKICYLSYVTRENFRFQTLIYAFLSKECWLSNHKKTSCDKLWIIFTTTPLRIARNSPNFKWPANMRVLEGVAHTPDYQHVAKFISQNELFSSLKSMPFGRLWVRNDGIRAVISIESWWVCSHIKLSSIIHHVLIQVISQFDMVVNPLWFNINHKTVAQTSRESLLFPFLECNFL